MKKHKIPKNPIKDPLTQELGYKLNGRTIGCLATLTAAGLFILLVVAVLFRMIIHH